MKIKTWWKNKKEAWGKYLCSIHYHDWGDWYNCSFYGRTRLCRRRDCTKMGGWEPTEKETLKLKAMQFLIR